MPTNGNVSGTNVVATVALVVIVFLALGAVIWFSRQPALTPTPSPEPGASIDVNLPGSPPAPSPTASPQ